MRLSRRTFLGASAAGVAAAALPVADAQATPPPRLDERIDWAEFLAGQDMVWTRVPATFFEAPFLGNGGLGAALFAHPTRARLQFTLGDSRVHDHQDVAGPVNNLGQTAEQSKAVWGQARLPIGYLTVETAGDVTGVDLRLSLRDATLAGTITTNAGSIELSAFVHATDDLLVVALTPSSGETAAWSFTPYPAISPRAAHNTPPAGLQANPDPVVSDGQCVQDLAAGGQTVTAWRTRVDHGTTVLVASVAHSYPAATAQHTATHTVEHGIATSLTRLAAAHRRWWHDFYPASFVSFGDARLQSFYWIQLYKMACATRAGRPVIGTSAEWIGNTGWPATWWNLNVQLEYWLIHPTRHTELDSLSRTLERYGDNLTRNVPEQYRHDSAAIGRTSQEDLRTAVVAVPGTISPDALPEVGNLTWILHDAWLAYRHTMDDRQLRETIYPLLRRSINFYRHFLFVGDDGRLHLPTTFSPEYALAPDCNYDLALLSWGCRTLLDITARLHIHDPLRPQWRDILARLVDPPQGADGLLIGAGVPLTSSHRHYSHILWYYPLHVLDIDTVEGRDLLERTLAHWVGLPGALQGYTFTGAASMSAMLGSGDQALTYLNTLLDQYIQPNTMYQEGGSPVMETPLSGAQSVHDMLFTGWDGVIRVFPGVPSGWDVTVHDVAVEGGFRLSSVRRGGVTQFVRIRSQAGEPCRVAPALAGPYDVRRLGHGGRVRWHEIDGVLHLDLRRGDDVVITTGGTAPPLRIEPVATSGGPTWGLP